MVAAINTEIKNFNTDRSPTIETIYFGGGTPSILSDNELQSILETIRENFMIADHAEITLEANPDDISLSLLLSWKDLGINRLSVGIQSFSESELKWMNRAHSADQSMRSLEDIRFVGFTNFSADLIYGSPFLKDEELQDSIAILEKFGAPHISAYALTVEPQTKLHHDILKKRSSPVDPDRQATQFEILRSQLIRMGFEHYEISNFAKPGFRSRHNNSYWLGLPYYGFGPSAHSFDGGSKRRWNIANNALYLKSMQSGLPAFEEETLTEDQQVNEYIMIALRTIEGISLKTLKNKFGEDEYERVQKVSRKFINEGLIENNGQSLYLTNEGKFLADGIAADLFR